MGSLTKEEESELQWLRMFQSDTTRWMSMWEFNRIAELQKKKVEQNFVHFDDHLRLD